MTALNTIRKLFGKCACEWGNWQNVQIQCIMDPMIGKPYGTIRKMRKRYCLKCGRSQIRRRPNHEKRDQ